VRPRRIVNLVPVEAAWDRIIRTTVGLRPHRPSGFVVRAEKLDDKTVVHNYGHGGAGHSLGWGTGYLATELALEHGDRRVAVVGCGTVGLTTARQLQRRGFAVTIFAMSVPPDTTSNMALAGFTPGSGLVDEDRVTAAWDAQFWGAAEISYNQLQLLVGRNYGVSWMDSYGFMNEVPPPRPPPPVGEGGSRPPRLRTGRVTLRPGEHPFPSVYASRRPSLRIEPSIYLDALVRDVLFFEGRIVIRKFDTLRDLMSLSESLIVNCTGLGSGTLFGDREIMPVKGQLTVLVPQPEVNYRTIGGVPTPGGDRRGFPIHMMPRSDGIVLGGTSQRGVWDMEPDEEARRQIVEAHVALFSAMRAPDPRVRLSHSAVPDEVPSLESFFGLES
jgi:glycine/D-amino acid oxidase-like deaminating enzyme